MMTTGARIFSRRRVEESAEPRIGRGIDKFIFLIVFLIGAFGIIALRTYLGIWQGYIIIWAIGWIVLYLVLVTLVERYRLRPDQAGDNLYYLGFLYTLVSLSVALYHFTDAEAALEQIISNFGIALATTILGIALRVVLHQMREDPLDTEREARLNLAEAASKLRAELDISAQEMSAFTRQMRQSVEEAFNELGKNTGSVLTESGGQVADAAMNAKGGIEQAFATFAEQAKSLNAVSRRQVQAAEKLIERIEAIDVPTDLLEQKLAPAVEKMARLADELENRAHGENKALKEVDELVAGVGRTAAMAEKHIGAMQQQVEASRGFAERLLPVVERLESFDRVITAASEASIKLADTQKQAAERQIAVLQGQVTSFEELHGKAAKQIEEFASHLGELREASARETLETMRGIAEHQREVITDFARQAQDSLSSLQQYKSAMQEEAVRARAATEEVMRHLTSMIRTLSRELGEGPQETRRPE